MTSDEAGQPIGPTFAFPVGLLVDSNIGKKVATNGHANGHINGSAKTNGAAKTKTNGVAKPNGKSN